jgi:hypothetical protein
MTQLPISGTKKLRSELEETVSPTTLSAPPPQIEGESLPEGFFKRIVTTSDNLNKKFALSKDSKLYSKADENSAWRIYLEGDQRFLDIGLGDQLYGIGQDDNLLYVIADEKSVNRIGSDVKLKEIVDVKDSNVIALAENGAEMYFDGRVWREWDSSSVDLH